MTYTHTSHGNINWEEMRQKVSNERQRKELGNVPPIRESMVKFEEWADRPVMILEREVRLSRPDATGKRNPYNVWLIDLGNELIYSYPPGGNTDAQLKHMFINNGNQPVKCVITPVPNQAGYMSYKWYDWTEQDETDFINMKETPVDNSGNVPF